MSIQQVGSFGETQLCDNYTKTKNDPVSFPLDLYECLQCRLVFISEVVDPHAIYDEYLYVTQSSPGLDQHFSEYASSLRPFIPARDGAIVDIGGNDGTLLSKFAGISGQALINVEPSSRAISACTTEGILSINGYFNQESASYIRSIDNVNLVFMNNMLANIPDLAAFLSALSSLFDSQTIGCIESSYLPDMVVNSVVDFIYHEHLYYFSATSLSNLLQTVGLEIFDVQHVLTKGGSVRYFIRNNAVPASPVSSAFSNMLSNEAKFFQYTNLSSWFARMKNLLSSVETDFLALCDQPVPVYGASPTTASLMALLPSIEVSYLIDDNSLKHGLYGPLKGAPLVVGSAYLAESKPAFLIIAAWRFSASILSRISSIDDYNPTVLLPLPVPRIAPLCDLISDLDLES